MGEQLAGKCHHEVGGITAFLLLHFAGHDDHLGGGVLNFELLEDGSGVTRHEDLVDVVHDHLLHAYV